MNKFYDELADWWYLISAPEDYTEEARFFLELLATRPSASLLELGSGGGNNAFHMKSAFSQVTLADLSPQMVALSQTLNPDCEHVVGDMRTLRLGRSFDAVFIHDALDYMTTQEDVKAALTTAFVHCKTGGLALFVPDHVRETFEAGSEHGGNDANGRGARYLEWSYDPDPTDNTYLTDYVFVLRQDGHPTHVEHEQHTLGLFGRDEWLHLLAAVGFAKPQAIEDAYGRVLFLGQKV